MSILQVTLLLYPKRNRGKDFETMIKRVAVINDLSGLGKCSLTAAIPVISVMGVQPCPIPTAVLTNQTDYESYHSVDFTDYIDFYTTEWKKRGITLDGIYTGYLGSEAQVQKILSFCENFRTEHTLLFVDPVMGDNGTTYDVYTPEYGKQMKRLIAEADVITPNLTECCMLAGVDYHELITHRNESNYLNRIEEFTRSLLAQGLKAIIVTGIIHQADSDSLPKYYNLVVTEETSEAVSCPIYGKSKTGYSGTGDLMASVICAGMVRGYSAGRCVRLAVHFLEAALIDTASSGTDRNDGLNFEQYLSLLLDDHA